MSDGNFDADGIYIGPEADEVLETAKRRFKRTIAWESDFLQAFNRDLKFAFGDSDNSWQWPNEAWLNANSGPESKPRLTINKTKQHNLIIINECKQNKAAVKFRPTGGEATFEAAQIYDGLMRAIERNSRADQAYTTATSFSVHGGIGYCRVITDYVSDMSFDQDVFIRRVKDPTSVLLDPDINEVDGSDAKFGFVYDDVPKEEFYKTYPKLKGKISPVPSGDLNDGWVTEDHIRVCEYFYVDEEKDTLISYFNEKGERETALKSKLPKDVYKALDADEMSKTRPVLTQSVTWCKIAGDKVIDTRPWPGKFIPIARMVGEEAIIEHKLHRASHTRTMKDPQRIYNFWSSSAVEHVAYQTKTRWFLPVGASDNFEEYYQNFNQRTTPFLPWNAINENGDPLPAPVPIEPPTMADAYIKGMLIAKEELMMASGQYQSQFGQNENATSGKAINERQRQGDTATYHWVDAEATMIRHVGNICKDLITKVYDTPRIIRILALDGTETRVQVDPMQEQAHVEATKELQEQKVTAIFNPRVGDYMVEADVGPSYATRRQEAWNAMTQIVSQNEGLTSIIGDLLFKNADFPGADEIAQRLARMVPAQATGDGPTPEMAQLTSVKDNLTKLLAEALEKLADAQREVKDKDEQLRREAYDARTKRITAVSNAEPELGEDRIKPLVKQMIDDALKAGSPSGNNTGSTDNAGGQPGEAGDEVESSAATESETPPLHGARKAPDGRWYLPDTKRKGKYSLVEMA